MILSTTPTIEGRPVKEYLGVVTGEVIVGANVFKDFLAGIRDFFGGRSSSYEGVLRKAKDNALAEMSERASALGANAIVGIDLDYETVGESGSMLMVSCSGTAVIFSKYILHTVFCIVHFALWHFISLKASFVFISCL